MDLTSKLQLAYLKLKAAKRVLLVGHTAPDADAIASLGAMGEIAASLGAVVYAYADKKPADVFDYIPGAVAVKAEPPSDLNGFDLVIALDCGSLARTALEAELKSLWQDFDHGRLSHRPTLIEIDHHETQATMADLEIRLPDKASTTEIIYHFLMANRLPISKSLANCILIGLMTDTGHFLHANSSRQALAVASEMLLRGASLPSIINRTVNNKNFASLKIWGKALDNLVFKPETGLAFSALSRADLQSAARFGDYRSDAELFGDIASFISRLDQVRVALLLREEETVVKGSLRTNHDDVDVAALARQFGGGGHKKAAGFYLPGRLVKTSTGWDVVDANI